MAVPSVILVKQRKENNTFLHCRPVPVSLSWTPTLDSGCGLLKVCSYDPKWKGKPFLYNFIWGKKNPWDRESHFFDNQMSWLIQCERWKSLPCLQKYTRVIEQFGLTEVWRAQLRSAGTILQGLTAPWEEPIFLVSCSLIRILCNTWDSPRTLIHCLFSAKN